MKNLPTELFWELVSELRCSILFELQNQNLKPTSLAKKLEQTKLMKGVLIPVM